MKKIYFAFFLLATITTTTQAQPGTPDKTFGNRGKLLSDFGSDEYTSHAALQQDRKIVVAGSYDIYPDDNARFLAAALFCYKNDGTTDSSFAMNGAALNVIGNSFSELKTVLTLDNGKIVAAGYANLKGYNNQLIVIRYTNSGKIDSSFGINGIASFGLSNRSLVPGGMVVTNNRLVVAATATRSEGEKNIVLVAFNQFGQIDSSFGDNGKTITSIGNYSGANAIVKDNRNRLIVAGFGIPQGLLNSQFAVLRYTASGMPDPAFGKNGIVVTALQKVSVATSVSVTSAGKITVLKYSTTNQKTVGEIVRLTESGKADAAFGNNGSVTTDVFADLLLQPNGKIITAGSRINSRNSKIAFGLSRFKNNGSIDSAFGDNGNVITDFGTAESFANALLLQPDGKIIAAGVATRRNKQLYNQDIAIAKYTGDNTLADEVIANNNLKQQIKVSPNPVKNLMMIESNIAFTNAEIIITDIAGNVLQKQSVNTASKNYSLPVNNLKSGLHNITIKNKDGNATEKFLKE